MILCYENDKELVLFIILVIVAIAVISWAVIKSLNKDDESTFSAENISTIIDDKKDIKVEDNDNKLVGTLVESKNKGGNEEFDNESDYKIIKKARSYVFVSDIRKKGEYWVCPVCETYCNNDDKSCFICNYLKG